MRAHGVLGDEESLRDLVGGEVLVEQQQHLDLARGEHLRDLVRDAVEPATLAHTIQEPAGNAAGEGCIAAGDSTQERRDLLGRLGLEEVAGRSCADRAEEVLLRVGSRENDDLAVRRLLANLRQRGQPVHARHRQVEQHEIRLRRPGDLQCLLAVLGLADDVEPLLSEQRSERVTGQRVVVDDHDALRHTPLIGTKRAADKRGVETGRQTYRSWLLGELLLVALLASATALFGVRDTFTSTYDLPEARLAFDTAIAVVATIVAVLASIRFVVEGRALDLLLAAGFWSIALGTAAFGLVPLLGGGSLDPEAAWSLLGSRILGAALIAAAPFTHRRLGERRKALLCAVVGVVAILVAVAVTLGAPPWSVGMEGGLESVEGFSVAVAGGLLASLWLVALIGFAIRFRTYGRDLDSWMCLAATLALFGDFHLILNPVVSSEIVTQGDFLRFIAYGVLLVGVWRAIAHAEFGRAVADERARVAREIHDGLAQYLFAITTQVSMLESGAPLEQVLPRLKRASVAAQMEARFAVLALSSAGGTAPFDSALRRYVDVLTADGALDVELDVDPQVRLAPDEQIEVFRIVQEGLGNARRHAGAHRVEVSIGQRNGRRIVAVHDDGIGFDAEGSETGQGLANMKLRAEAIDGEISLESSPGRGTAIEVVLRPV